MKVILKTALLALAFAASSSAFATDREIPDGNTTIITTTCTPHPSNGTMNCDLPKNCTIDAHGRASCPKTGSGSTPPDEKPAPSGDGK